MGHVQFILNLKVQPQNNRNKMKNSFRQNSNLDIPEIQRLISLWGSEINYLNSQIENYKRRLGNRKVTSPNRKWMRDIIRVYSGQVIDITTKRDAAVVKLHLSGEDGV